MLNYYYFLSKIDGLVPKIDCLALKTDCLENHFFPYRQSVFEKPTQKPTVWTVKKTLEGDAKYS